MMAKNNKGKVVQMLSPENYIRKKARTLPVYKCIVNEDWDESKIVQLSVSRNHTNGNITACFYLIDLLCLGVKDTHYVFNIPKNEYEGIIEDTRNEMPTVDISYELAHNIVFAGLEFAEDYGFKPHKDFTSVTRFMLEEDTEDIELMEIECGINGQPVYMRGPYDDDAKVKRITAQLEETAGPGNYTIMNDEFDDEFDDDDDEFDDNLEAEIEGLSASEKKNLFLDMSFRLENLTKNESERFLLVIDSIVDDLIDVDLHNQIYDEYDNNLNIETDEDEIPDELLGIQPGDAPITDELKAQFLALYELIMEDPKQAAINITKFKTEANGLACADLLELFLLQANESSKYPKLLKKYAGKYPKYQLIQVLWATEQIITKTNGEKIQENQFKLKSFFPNRATIHPIEKYYFLSMQAYLATLTYDINRIEAFSSILGNLNLDEVHETTLNALLLMIKTNYLISYLKD